MQISDEGLRLIKNFEGYHTRLKDGSCAAYLCPAGVPTIGHGVTEGVKIGMVWTAEEAETALRRELAKFEATVARLVTVNINQNERDALISLAYNIGSGAFQRSSVLWRLNQGDRKGAAKAFEMWTKATVKGRKVDLPGLVSRRKREAALFLKPVEAPELPAMPQAVVEAKEVSKPAIAVGAAAVATAAPAVVPLPAVPDVVTQSISQIEIWKTTGVAVWTLKAWAMAEPILASGLAISMAGFYAWSRKQQGGK
jgi:lysozyme